MEINVNIQMDVTKDEKAFIEAIRKVGLSPFTILMDGVAYCNARKVDNQYNQAFFTDRYKLYEVAQEDFNRNR